MADRRLCKKCGEAFSPRADNRPNRGQFCSVACAKSKQFSERVLDKNPQWRGGKKRKRDHMLVKSPGHPNADCNGYVCEYRLVMEQELGRYLTRKEVVHHINGDEQDLTPTNLCVLEDQAAHSQLHAQLQQVAYELVKTGVIGFSEDGGYQVASYVAGRIQRGLERRGVW